MGGKFFWAGLMFAVGSGVLNTANAQIVFQPPNCEFSAVFVSKPTVTAATMNDEAGKPGTEIIAALEGSLQGQPNIFRAECIPADVPSKIDPKNFLDDMQTLATGNSFKNAKVWVETKANGEMVGHVRGNLTDSLGTFVIELRRYIGSHSIFDVWIGSTADVFPSEANTVFLKELRRDGKTPN